MTFDALYYDGDTPLAFKARVTPERYYISISYTNANGAIQTVQWNTDKVNRANFATPGAVELTYNTTPQQKIEVADRQIIEVLKTNYPNADFHQKKSFQVNKLVLVVLVLLALGIGLIALGYFVVVPAIAEKLAEKIPVSYEEKLGETIYSNSIKKEQVNDSSTILLNSFFNELNYPSDYHIKLTVVKSDIVNAYAMPGGHIVVYEGILRKMNGPTELAALLSHEFSHVQLRHTTKGIFRSLSAYMLLTLLPGDGGGFATKVLQNANELKQLGYTRELEEEADRNGMRLMQQNKVDINGMKQLFETLKTQETGAEPFQFLSTHPLTDARIEAVTKEIAVHKVTSQPQPVLDSLWLLIKAGQGDY